jgi:hypothetical protein
MTTPRLRAIARQIELAARDMAPEDADQPAQRFAVLLAMASRLGAAEFEAVLEWLEREEG